MDPNSPPETPSPHAAPTITHTGHQGPAAPRRTAPPARKSTASHTPRPRTGPRPRPAGPGPTRYPAACISRLRPARLPRAGPRCRPTAPGAAYRQAERRTNRVGALSRSNQPKLASVSTRRRFATAATVSVSGCRLDARRVVTSVVPREDGVNPPTPPDRRSARRVVGAEARGWTGVTPVEWMTEPCSDCPRRTSTPRPQRATRCPRRRLAERLLRLQRGNAHGRGGLVRGPGHGGGRVLQARRPPRRRVGARPCRRVVVEPGVHIRRIAPVPGRTPPVPRVSRGVATARALIARGGEQRGKLVDLPLQGHDDLT